MKITTDITPAKSLTPQRKHRKLLKSGEGEVWSEDVERIFVDGLHKYWESPWATYSRGRSRWRNQFLVDYLAKHGIERSKKQVASHVQVLRNMWKGEKEYHLVAGGEELFLETGLLAPVKKEDASDPSLLSPADTDDSYMISPITPPTSGLSPPPFKIEDHKGLIQMPQEPSIPGSPAGSGDSHILGPSPVPLIRHARVRSSSLPGLHRRYTAPISSPLAPRPASYSSEVPAQPYPCMGPDSLSSPASSSFLSIGDQSISSVSSSSSHPNSLQSEPPITHSPHVYHEPSLPNPGIVCTPSPPAVNRLNSIALFAEGMTPFIIPLASVYSPSSQRSPRLFIRIKLRLPSIDDIQGSPTLHGIHGSVSLARPWVSSATCTTDVYAASVHHSRDMATLQSPTVDPVTAESTAGLPDSELTRCRWLDSSKQTTIYQRIVVDNDTMAVIVYDLDRTFCDNSPFAEVTGIQRYRVNSEKSYASNSAYSNGGTSSISPQPYCPYRSRYPPEQSQPSLSCALTPSNDRSKSPLSYTPKPQSQLCNSVPF